MSIDTSVVSSINSGGATAKTASQSAEMRDSFMTLLITQLQNQDPLKPMENAEMTSQLAQINTVNGIEELNETLNGITSQIGAGQTMQAVGLIDKAVLVPGNNVKVNVGEDGESYATPFGIELDKPAENVTVTISNKSGEVVYTKELGAVQAGVESFSWGGKTTDGEAVPDGAYKVSFKATDAEGEDIESSSLNYALVNGVTPADDNGSVRLDLGAVYGQVTLDQVKQIL